jgi:hypothetical protein
MAGLTEDSQVFGKTDCKVSLKDDAHAIRLDLIQPLIFVRYCDHVLYNRASALLMQPQIREAVGWLVYEAEQYIILSWDRDTAPPTLHGGDPKASGLVLLKTDILDLQKLTAHPLQRNFEVNLNRKPSKQENESAFRRPSERKTHSTTGEKKQ